MPNVRLSFPDPSNGLEPNDLSVVERLGDVTEILAEASSAVPLERGALVARRAASTWWARTAPARSRVSSFRSPPTVTPGGAIGSRYARLSRCWS